MSGGLFFWGGVIAEQPETGEASNEAVLLGKTL